jgi:hypothetical protein
VVTIHHPGKGLLVLGLSLIALGLVTAATAAPDNGASVSTSPPALGIALFAVPGLILAVAGGATYWSSKAKARAFESAPP